MLIPVRCYTCNNVLADKIIPFETKMETNNEFFESRKLKYCCRNILMTHVDIHNINIKKL